MILQEQYNRTRFINQIQNMPFCTDDFERDGIYRAKKDEALKKIYIEHNNKSFINSIVFDLDIATAGIAWSEAGIPKPNVIMQNPANGHAHILYALSSPVCITERAHKKPIGLVKGITEGLTARLGADPCYTGKITKNPLNPAWRVFWGNVGAYDLSYLREFVDEKKRLARTPFVRSNESTGRNTALFDNLRYYAYSIVFKYQKNEDFNGFYNAVEEEAAIINSEFTEPLPLKEVKHTIKSIVDWTFDNFDYEEFSQKQSARGKMNKGKKRKEVNALIDFLGGEKSE